jgi:hypothetical protein
MGLWDILVPTEPGVLHNLIANPSFEYDNNEVNDISYTYTETTVLGFPELSSVELESFRKLPSNTGIRYWYSGNTTRLTRSSDWASRGAFSLKYNNQGAYTRQFYYAPRLSTPSYFNTTVTASWFDNIADNGNIPTSQTTYIAVVGLTDIGLSLANGVVDNQVYGAYSAGTSDDKIAYPTIDAMRGHMKPIFTTLAASGSNLYSIKVQISNFNEEVTNTVRGWAVFVSQDSTATKIYHLTGIIPATRKNWALVGGVYVAPNEYQLIIGNIPSAGTGATSLPFTPTLGTGKLYMFPLGTNGTRIVRGKGTSFLTQFQSTATNGITSGIDVYIVVPNQTVNKKQFLGRTASRGITASSGKLSCTSGSTSVTLTGAPSGFDLVGRALYVGSTFVGIVESAASSTSITLENNAPSTITNSLYNYTLDSQTEFQLQTNATQIVVNTDFYYVNETNPQAFPDNNFGAISTFSTNGTTYLPASMGKDCSVPYFGITNSSFPADSYRHHLYLDWQIAPENPNPNATYSGTGADWSVYLVNTKLDSVVTSETLTIAVGSTTGTSSAPPSFAAGALLFTSTYDFVGEVSYADTSSGYFELISPARVALSGVTGRYVSASSGTFLGTLDDATVTDSAAYRVRFRQKFLIDRPSGDTSDMMIRFACTNPANQAELYIDGVQFVDVGMIWRSYDFWAANPTSYINPPHFSDWDWDDVEFSYIDGDVPGALWSDTMPTQSGTTSAGWPYFSDTGVWMKEVWNASVSEIQQGGYSSPAMREQRQWRNEGKPVYGVSVPGLSQSSLQTQTFETGFWTPLDTDNINVVVEPTISGTGMPEIATTALEYGIVDGGFVQRQVARMRNMQFTVTISAQSWTGLHANRRSIINLIKFDQLAQQGERMLRYRGATTPVVTKITYVGGLEFGGVQSQSFTETLGLRFLSADPYFYTEVPLSQDISPTEIDKNVFNVVHYKLGNNSEWRPLSTYLTQIDYQNTSDVYSVKTQASTVFSEIPKAIGWLQSPSGNVSALVVGGNFQYPFPSLAFFYVSGFRPDTTIAADSVEFISSGTVTFTSALNSTSGTYSAAFSSMIQTQTGLDVFLYTAQGIYVGKITSVNTSLLTFTIDNNVHPAYTNALFYIVYARDISIASPPLMVYSRQLFQLDGGTSATTTSVNDIYQESPTSLLVVGDFYRVTEIGMQQPNTNFNTTSQFKNKGRVSSRVESNDIPYSIYFRVARFVMNDNGKIVVYPADSQFDSVYSVVYNLIENRTINKVTKAQSGYVFLGTDTLNSVDGYDSINNQLYEEYPVMRGPNAYAVARHQSSVVGMSPQINFSISTTDSETYAGFVGFRLGRQAQGTITTYPTSLTSRFLAVGNNVSFTADDVGKTIITVNGTYIGQIFGFLEQPGVNTYSIAVLTEPAKAQVTNSAFVLLSPIQSLTTDKRTTNAAIIAALESSDDDNYRTSVWTYIPNPTIQGRLSTVEGSTSFGYIGNILNDLGLLTSGLINAKTSSAVVTGQRTAFTNNMIGNYLNVRDVDGTFTLFLGQIKSVESSTSLTLAQNSFANAGGVFPTTPPVTTKGTLSTASSALLTTINASTASFVAGDVGKYLYLYDSNAKKLSYVGLISTFVSTTQILVSTNELNQTFSLVKGVISTIAYYVDYNVQSQKLFTKADGYIARTGYIQSVNSTTNVGVLSSNATLTSSTTQTPGFSKNAATMFSDTSSPTVLINAQSLPSKTLTSYILRRNFDADSTVSEKIYDPSSANNERVAYASFTFGSVRPNVDNAYASGSGTLIFFGRYIQTSSSLTTGFALFINYNNESIVFVGVISGTTIVNGVTYYLLSWDGAGVSAKPVFEYSFTHTGTFWQARTADVNESTVWINWDAMRTEPILAANIDSFGVARTWNIPTNTTIIGFFDCTLFNQRDVGRSVYVLSGSQYVYLGIIKTVEILTTTSGPVSNYIRLTITPSASFSGVTNSDIYVSGGSRFGTGNRMTWYPYQFGVRSTVPSASTAYAIYDSGMESSIAYTGTGATPAPTCTAAGILTVNLQLTSDYQCPAPTSIDGNVYDLYAYLSGYPASDVFIPSQIGQWYYIGEITLTTSSSISYRANSSGAGNTIASSNTSTFVTITGSPNARALVGSNIYRSDTGAFIGRVIDVNASNTNQVRLSVNAVSTYTGTYYYSPSFPTNITLVRGTPLSIVGRLTIYTDNPASYAVNDELLAYSTNQGGYKPRYIGTIQKIISTTSGTTMSSVTVSYYPVFYLDAGFNAPYVDSNVSTVASGVYKGYTTILRATKTVRGSSAANFFANTVSTITATTANTNNSNQTSQITLAGNAGLISPNQYQIIDIPTTTFTATTALKNVTISTTSVTLTNSVSVTYTSTAITSVGFAIPARHAIWRADGNLIGYTGNTANTLVAGPLYSTEGLASNYYVANVATSATLAYATITATAGSATVTFAAGTSGLIAEDIIGRAIWALSDATSPTVTGVISNNFVGVVKVATSATSFTLYAPSPISVTANRFAYGYHHVIFGSGPSTITNAVLPPNTTPGTITATAGVTTATRSDKIMNYTWGVTTANLNFTYGFGGMGLFRLNGQYLGVVLANANNVATVTFATGAYNSTVGEEPYIFMRATNIGTVNTLLYVTASAATQQNFTATPANQTIPPTAIGCAIYRISTASTNTSTVPIYHNAVFLGCVQNISGSTMTFTQFNASWTGRGYFMSPIGDKPTACTPAGFAGIGVRRGSITATAGSKQFTLDFPAGVINGCAADDMPGKAVFDIFGNFLGVVEYADSAYVGYFRDNATASVSGVGFFWAPTSLPGTIANDNQVRSLTPSRRGSITSVAGSATITVTGQPDAYSLVNRTLRDGNGNLIGIGASASNHNTLTLVANALVSTTQDINYTYSASTTDGSNIPLSTLATLKYWPTSAFTFDFRPWLFVSVAMQLNGIFRQNGQFMGGLGSYENPNSYRVQFLHMPYSVTLGSDEWFCWVIGPTVAGTANPPSAHYPAKVDVFGYGTIATVGQTTFTTTFSNPSWLVGAALYVNLASTGVRVDSVYTGRVASVSGTTVTLIEGALVAGDIYHASFTPYVLVMNTTDAIGRTIYPYSATTPSDYMGIVDDIAYGNMGALTAPARTISNMFYPRFNVTGLFPLQENIGSSVAAAYSFVSASLKYTLQVGDVIRNSSNAIVGQVLSYDWQNRQLFLLNNARVSVSAATVRVHHKSSNSRFVGGMVGTISTMTYQDETYTTAIIKGVNTRFSTIPYDVLHRLIVQEYETLYSGSVSSTQINNPWKVGTEFYILANGLQVRLGVISDILDDTTLVITVSVEGQAFGSFTGKSYAGGYSMLSVPGLGGAIVSNTGYMASVLKMSYTPEFPSTLIPNMPTKFTEQGVNGAYVWFLDTTPAGISVDGYVNNVFTNNLMSITEYDGSPRNNRSTNSSYIYSIAYRYDESVLWDFGEQVYVNNDWQPFGAHNGQVLDVTTTQNGTIIASGKFTKWSDATDTTNSSSRNVGRVARLVPLIANGVMFDAYASPIVGSSYVKNGMNNTAYITRDITDINPVTGYVGSSDRLLIGGTFTETLDGEKVSPGLVSAEGSTLSGNLQSIISSDIQFPQTAYTVGNTKYPTEVRNIASSTRLRQYYSNPNINNLDGINGANLAIITNATQINRTTQYYSLRVRGNASTYPIINIRNESSSTIKIYELIQTETGARIRFANNGLQVLEYEAIIINCIPGQRSISSNIRGNMLSFLHPSSNFVDWVLLGSNNSAGKSIQSFDDYHLNVIGIHADLGFVVTISYTPRFWSFDANNMFFGTTKAGV